MDFEATSLADLGDRSNGELNYISAHHRRYFFFEYKCIVTERIILLLTCSITVYEG